MRRHSLAIGVALIGGAVSVAQADNEPTGNLRSPLGVNSSVDVVPATVSSGTPAKTAEVAANKQEAAGKDVTAPKEEAKAAPEKHIAAKAPNAKEKAAASKAVAAAPAAASADAKPVTAAAAAAPAPQAATVAAPAPATPAAPAAAASASAKKEAVAEAKPATATPPAAKGTEPAPAAAKSADTSARQALAKNEGDTDNKKLLESVLESSERNYSLLKKGEFDFNYDFNYTFIGNESIEAATTQNTAGETVLNKFAINKAATHSFTNTISMDYGLRNNLTVGAAFPLVYKLDVQGANHKRWVTGMGDIAANARWQPFSLSRTMPSLTLNGSLRLPTGVSPYEIDANTELSTGSGTFGLSLGGNVSKVVDPVVLFSSLTWGTSFEKTGLNQIRGNEGRRLQKVLPGDSWSFGMGLGYALSYDVSLNLSTSMAYSKPTVLTFNNEVQSTLDPSTSGTFNIGVGWRLDPKFTLNITTGIGLTRESPDFSMGASMPINF